jgi:hypothetical protein
MKLKDFRGQPLLNPPGEGGSLMRMSPEDEAAIMKKLKAGRRQRDGLTVAMIHSALARMGITEPVKDADLDAMWSHLGESRRLLGGEGSGWAVARMHVWLRQLGAAAEVTAEDRRIIRKRLREERANGGKGSRDLAGMLYLMKQLGMRENVTAADRQIMVAQLRRAREGPGTDVGGDLAQLHHFMRQLGLQEQVTEGDVEAIRKSLQEDRKRGSGLGIAHMLSLMREVIPPRAEECPMPPLKRFGR